MTSLMNHLNELRRDWAGFSFMNDFTAQGDRVVAIGQVAWRNKATGKIADTPKIDVWRFPDGKAAHLMEFDDTARSIAAATLETQ